MQIKHLQMFVTDDTNTVAVPSVPTQTSPLENARSDRLCILRSDRLCIALGRCIAPGCAYELNRDIETSALAHVKVYSF